MAAEKQGGASKVYVPKNIVQMPSFEEKSYEIPEDGKMNDDYVLQELTPWEKEQLFKEKHSLVNWLMINQWKPFLMS